MKKEENNNKYLLIGLVALIIVVILLDMRYTGYQIYTPLPLTDPDPSLNDQQGNSDSERQMCIDGCYNPLFEVKAEDKVSCKCACYDNWGGNPLPDECISLALCGNDELNPNEQCDDGNRIDGDGCNSRCILEGCGDNYLDAGEECDDGNEINHDGCSSTCLIEPEERCGRGRNNRNVIYVCGVPREIMEENYYDMCAGHLLNRIGVGSSSRTTLIDNWWFQHFDQILSNQCATINSMWPKCLCWKFDIASCSVGRGSQHACNINDYDEARCQQYSAIEGDRQGFERIGDREADIFCATQTGSQTSACYCHRRTSSVFCGNGVCDPGETYINCPEDNCNRPPSNCGDGSCDATNGETFSNCPRDCTTPPTTSHCGDGSCDPSSENSISCPSDCSAPPLTGANSRDYQANANYPNTYSTTNTGNYPSTNTPYTIPSTYDAYGNPITTTDEN